MVPYIAGAVEAAAAGIAVVVAGMVVRVVADIRFGLQADPGADNLGDLALAVEDIVEDSC